VIIEAYRFDGDRIGNPISEPMLSDNVLSVRARAEMDAHAHPLNRVTLDIPYVKDLELGQLISVSDPLRPAPYKGVLRGVSISVRDSDIQTTIDLDVPT
jgi:hypothetical protein